MGSIMINSNTNTHMNELVTNKDIFFLTKIKDSEFITFNQKKNYEVLNKLHIFIDIST